MSSVKEAPNNTASFAPAVRRFLTEGREYAPAVLASRGAEDESVSTSDALPAVEELVVAKKGEEEVERSEDAVILSPAANRAAKFLPLAALFVEVEVEAEVAVAVATDDEGADGEAEALIPRGVVCKAVLP